MKKVPKVLIGSVIGLGLIRYFKFKQPLKYNSFNWTVKACLYTMPTLGFTAFLTDRWYSIFQISLSFNSFTTGKASQISTIGQFIDAGKNHLSFK